MPTFETDDKQDDNEKRGEWVRNIRKQPGGGKAQKDLNGKTARVQERRRFEESFEPKEFTIYRIGRWQSSDVEFDGGDCPND